MNHLTTLINSILLFGLGPLGILYGINLLFGLEIAYTFQTWFFTLFLIGVYLYLNILALNVSRFDFESESDSNNTSSEEQ